MRLTTLSLLLLAMPAGAGAAGDLSGKWTFDGDVMGNAVNLTCTVQQNAQAKLAGQCDVNGMEQAEITGEASDAGIEFAITVQGYTLTYTGKVEGDTANGTIEVAGVSGTFEGKRAK